MSIRPKYRKKGKKFQIAAIQKHGFAKNQLPLKFVKWKKYFPKIKKRFQNPKFQKKNF
jgi:hypothetical protein